MLNSIRLISRARKPRARTTDKGGGGGMKRKRLSSGTLHSCDQCEYTGIQKISDTHPWGGMTRVNMGDRPAGQISTEAVYKTAELFEADSPNAAKLLRDSTYVDDIIEPETTRQRISNDLEVLANKVLSNPAKKHANMPL